MTIPGNLKWTLPPGIFHGNMLFLMKRKPASYYVLKRKLAGPSDAFLAQKLTGKSLVKLSGRDASIYLQGLITNDMNHFQSGVSSIFAMFLNTKGRVLYDTIIYKMQNEDAYLIECDSRGTESLRDHLLRFKIRRKINVDILDDEINIYALTKANYLESLADGTEYKKLSNLIKERLPKMIATTDPRLLNMGLRLLVEKNTNLNDDLSNVANIKLMQKNFYKTLRYSLGIGEGMTELPSEKCFPMEVNGDYLHGISFHKGCYIGQEFTARTYHTGVIRKRIMPICLNDELKTFEPATPIYSTDLSNKPIGKLLGAEQTQGIALLRIEDALKAPEMIISKNKCKTQRPFWWPIEAPKTRMNVG